MDNILLIIIFIILVITLLNVVYNNKRKEAAKGFDTVISAALDEPKFQGSNIKRDLSKLMYKAKKYKIVNQLSKPFKSVFNIIDKRVNNQFDHVTYDQLEDIKRCLFDETNAGNLRTALIIKGIDYNSIDQTIEKTKHLCIYDQEIELLMLLGHQFFNESLLKQKMRNDVNKLIKLEVDKLDPVVKTYYIEGSDNPSIEKNINIIDYKIKMKVIDEMKKRYDNDFLTDVITTCIKL